MTAVHSDDLELLERLGGTEATVHRGMVRTTGRVVVVKQAAWDRPDVVDRLGRESAVLRRVQHPSLVRLLDTIDDEQGRMLVLAHAPGGSLSSRLERHGPLPAAEVADLGTRLAEALAALHRAGVVHRDVHPGNVVVDAELQPVLADLDHALDQQSGSLPGDVEVVGHPDHVDPRLFVGAPVGPANDLHGLATTLWTAVTGAPPPRSAPDQPIRLPDDPRVPAPLRSVVDDCLAGDLDAATAATELRAVAIELLQHPTAEAPPPRPSLPPPHAVPPGPPPPIPQNHGNPVPAAPPPQVADPSAPPAACLPPAGAGAAPAVGRPRLAAGTSEASTRRWGPVTDAQARFGAGTGQVRRGRSAPRVVSFAVGLVVLLVGGSRLVGAILPEDPAPDGAVEAPVTAATATPVVPPPPCPGEDPQQPDSVLADLDGDGCSEALWLEDGILHAPAGRFRAGEPDDVLVAGDWDGDGAWGVGLYRPATGHVFLFDDAPGPGARSRPAGQLAPGGAPVVVAGDGAHRVELAPAG